VLEDQDGAVPLDFSQLVRTFPSLVRREGVDGSSESRALGPAKRGPVHRRLLRARRGRLYRGRDTRRHRRRTPAMREPRDRTVRGAPAALTCGS
jgi:hypothetical protein